MPLTATVSNLTISVPSGNNPSGPVTVDILNALGQPTVTLSGALSTAQLGDRQVTSDKLADDAVIARTIADNQIGLDHLSGQVAGSLLYWDLSGDPVLLAPGNNGQELIMSGGLPSWGNVSGGTTNPSDLSASMVREDLAADDDLIVGDDSAGVPKRLPISESLGVVDYVQSVMIPTNLRNLAPGFGNGPPDSEDVGASIATIGSAAVTGARRWTVVTPAIWGGEVLRVDITNVDDSAALSAGSTADVVVLDAPPNHLSGTGNASIASVTTSGSLAVGATETGNFTSSNTFSAGDMVVIRATSAGGSNKIRVTVHYKLNRVT